MPLDMALVVVNVQGDGSEATRVLAPTIAPWRFRVEPKIPGLTNDGKTGQRSLGSVGTMSQRLLQ